MATAWDRTRDPFKTDASGRLVGLSKPWNYSMNDPSIWAAPQQQAATQATPFTVNGMEVSNDQYRQLKRLDQLAQGGYIDPGTANAMISEALMSPPDPYAQYMGGLGGQMGMQGNMGMMGGNMGMMGYGQYTPIGQNVGDPFAGLQIEVPDSELM